MRVSKFFTITILFLSLNACDISPEQLKSDFSIITNTNNGAIKNDKTLNLSLANNKSHLVDSVIYKLNDKIVNNNVFLADKKLGKQTIKAIIYSKGNAIEKEENITILSSQVPIVYSFEIINEFPHDINAYTQGLEFYNGELFESTGQYGKSQLRKVNYKTGEILKQIELDKKYFGEGLSILNKKLYQLTWQEATGFIYDVDSFEKTGSFKYGSSKEGWGICNDGTTLFKSDGTEKIWTLNPNTLIEEGYIQAYHHKGKTVGLNELEFIDGKIYANRYQLNGVAIINPKNGAIEGVVDFSALKDKVTQHPKLDVLNGIAHNPETKTLFVTGKYWDKLFEVQIVQN
jgi:glutamine cyclotransferase